MPKPRPRSSAVAKRRDPVAVVDIGSNSGRVMVFRPEAGGHLHVLAGSRAALRLARDLDRTGKIPPEALERAFAALRDFRAIALGSGVRRIEAAGTSAIRDAANGPAFMKRVKRELGITIRILSGLEEARFGFLGAVGGLPVDDGVFFDLGGGSLQVGRFRERRLVGAVSVPLGSLRVSDAFLKSDPPSPREVRKLREHARKTLQQAGVQKLAAGERLVGTGGSLRNLAKVDQRAHGYPIARLHGYELALRRLREIAMSLAGVRQKKRARVAGLNSDRRDSVVGGALVIETLMELLRADAVVVSGQGVREGLALAMARESLDATEAVRRRSLDALGARFVGWSEERAFRREALAGALYAALERWPSAELEGALRQAARVVDVGRTVDFFDRHEHAADLVLATDLAGFSHRQVALLAAVVRQAGDEDERLGRSLAPLVTKDDEGPIERAAVLLALADEITERTPPGSRPGLDCRVRKGEVVVSVKTLPSWAVRGLGDRFEAAFGRKLKVVPGAAHRSRAS
jgi:exopolyphosphatase/guanosine-5'-triphosphate,3'-diphosphate pyrophosphatase